MIGKRVIDNMLVSPTLIQENTIMKGGYLPFYKWFQFDHGYYHLYLDVQYLFGNRMKNYTIHFLCHKYH